MIPSAFTFLKQYKSYLGIDYHENLEVTSACDNEALLKKEQHIRQVEIPNSHDQLKSDMDVIMLTINQYSHIPNISHDHVYGHQDANDNIENLSWLSQLNVEADALATKALKIKDPTTTPIPLGEVAYIIIDNDLLTSQYSSELKSKAGRMAGLSYLKDKLNLTNSDYNTIDWDAYRLARQKLPFKAKAFAAKRLCDWLPTNERRHQCHETSSPKCPHCSAHTENFDHILRCPALSDWRHRFIDGLVETLVDNKTPVELSREIQQLIREWLQGRLNGENIDLWMKGLIPLEWSDQVNDHLRNIDELTYYNNGRTWAKKLSRYVILETYEAWKIRSSLVDTSHKTASERAARESMQQAITTLYELKDQCDLKYPFSKSLRQRLLMDNNHLSSLTQIPSAQIAHGIRNAE
jgi:hypothetical protein